MKPMGKISTPFLSYDQIKTDKIDLYEDAFGFATDFNKVISLLEKAKPIASNDLTVRLLEKIKREI
jgi:hypothetical protein